MYDLTSVKPQLRTLRDLLKSASIADTAPDELSARHLDAAEAVSEQRLEATATDPVTADEVWAAGVTYQISEEARTEESGTPETNLDETMTERRNCYTSRPLGLSTPTKGRHPSRLDWDVPEPERNRSRRGRHRRLHCRQRREQSVDRGRKPAVSPTGESVRPLLFHRPVWSPEDVEDPHELEMSMTIERDGEVIYDDATNTSEMVRSCDELVSYFTRHNTVPELAVILTGTSLVPEQPFDLQEGDHVSINIESIGTLNNSVTVV